jgi:putative ABC transport system ATP-binding protein
MTAVSARGLAFTRGGRRILDGVDIDVEFGTSTALVGPSGTGKSTLLSLLAGLVDPDAGAIERSVAPEEIGLVLQAYGLAGLLTAAENVEIALQPGGPSPLPRDEVRRRAAAALDQVHLLPVADHLVEELSGGQQQRVAIARALAVRPRLLIADEFTAELDAASRATISDLVLGAVRRDTALVIATHDLRLAERCDRIVRLAAT